MDATFTANEFHHGVLQKSQTTDGNMTEITPAVIDGLIDEDSKYCHLSIDENQIIESDELGNHSTHLYHLLTASNGKEVFTIYVCVYYILFFRNLTASLTQLKVDAAEEFCDEISLNLKESSMDKVFPKEMFSRRTN